MRRQNSGLKNFLWIFIFGLILGCTVFVYFSPIFEKNSPKISFKNSGYWNLKDDLSVSVFDESGIKSYKAYYKVNKEEKVLVDKSLEDKQTDVVFTIPTFRLPLEVKKVKIFIPPAPSPWGPLELAVSLHPPKAILSS